MRAVAFMKQNRALPGVQDATASHPVTLKVLINHSLLQPGEDVLTTDYKGVRFHGSLLVTGQILYSDNDVSCKFRTPSGFSLYVKKLITPMRKADDGWKSVKYQGQVLEDFKKMLVARQQ